MQHEKHITLCEAAKISPGRPSANTLWRWCRLGIRSRSGQQIHLEHIRAGGKIFTTAESLQRFFTAVAAADAEHFDKPRDQPDLPRTGCRRRDRHRPSLEVAEEYLDSEGI